MKKSELKKLIKECIEEELNESLKKVELSMADMVNLNKQSSDKLKIDGSVYEQIKKKWFKNPPHGATITSKDAAIKNNKVSITRKGKSLDIVPAGPYLKVTGDGKKTEFYKI